MTEKTKAATPLIAISAGFEKDIRATRAGLDVAAGFRVPALALGVQWHPENLWATEPAFLNLFSGPVDAARRYRGTRREAGRELQAQDPPRGGAVAAEGRP